MRRVWCDCQRQGNARGVRQKVGSGSVERLSVVPGGHEVAQKAESGRVEGGWRPTVATRPALGWLLGRIEIYHGIWRKDIGSKKQYTARISSGRSQSNRATCESGSDAEDHILQISCTTQSLAGRQTQDVTPRGSAGVSLLHTLVFLHLPAPHIQFTYHSSVHPIPHSGPSRAAVPTTLQSWDNTSAALKHVGSSPC